MKYFFFRGSKKMEFLYHRILFFRNYNFIQTFNSFHRCSKSYAHQFIKQKFEAKMQNCVDIS